LVSDQSGLVGASSEQFIVWSRTVNVKVGKSVVLGPFYKYP